jgi:hypothetical protein
LTTWSTEQLLGATVKDSVAFKALLVEGWSCFSFVEAASPRSGSTALRFGVSVFIECGGSHESIDFSSILLSCLADQMSSKV